MVLGAVYNPQPQYPVNPLRSAPAAPYPTMRYYRLWIYTCNALLFMSAIGFSIVLAKVLILDPRRQLVPTLSLAQPSFLYAYAALLFQSGVLQTIGCLGASRLNDRLLNIYLLLLLVLLLGDILLGVVWLFRYDKISTDLRPLLNHSLVLRYGVDSEFTSLWDAVQSQYRCCGVYGYADFLQYNLTVDSGLAGSPPPAGTIALPKSCCRESPLVAAALRNFHYAMSTSTTTASPSSPGAAHIVTRTAASRPATLGSRAVDERRCASGGLIHQQNCHRIILDWLNSTAHILFVLGYCVIAFIKLCFLGILRYEIREMIQKIKLVQESEKAEGAEMAKTTKQNNGTILQAVQSHSIERKHSIIYAPDEDRKLSKRVAVIKLYSDDFMEVEVRDGGESERKSNPSKPDKRHVSNVLQDAGTDSDTNSHCALILNDASDTPAHTGGTAGTTGTNGNNNYEMGDLSGHRPRT